MGMSKYNELDVVLYDTGKTYFVCGRTDEQTVWVSGWKNGKPFGATRAIDPARCTLIGKAIRPQVRGDSWGFTPGS